MSLGRRGLSELMVERGHACVLEIPPAGADRADAFEQLEAAARQDARGMWGACAEVDCG